MASDEDYTVTKIGELCVWGYLHQENMLNCSRLTLFNTRKCTVVGYFVIDDK